MSKFDSDGFQIVSSKKCFKNKNTKIPPKNNISDKVEIYIDIDKLSRNIQNAVYELEHSEYFKTVLKTVSTNLTAVGHVEIVCFGLGHIGESIISRYQLGLLLCLKNKLNPRKILVHDPIFYKSECTVLENSGLDVLEDNTEGSYIVSKDCVTLLFFPHCPKQLTNNFLWSNWGTVLSNCILICNSFSSLFENQIDRILADTVPYINKIFPHTKEITLANNFKYGDIFNDISVHTFPEAEIFELNKDFWFKGSKPEYRDNEEFITTLMIDKLKI